jgi:hypothetical protein
MAGEMRQGTAREFIVDSIELDPAEGTELTYRLSGRAGEIHTAGNGHVYGESNPHAGYVKQDVSVNGDTYAKLKAIQTAGRFVSVSVTTVGNDLLTGQLAIGGDALENANGVVSLEMHGALRIN